ncbi:MAG: hypothetical protein CW338_06335 [Clostridiales bacterium]|nr:hypothetical protein [Clostridiales bacterium]
MIRRLIALLMIFALAFCTLPVSEAEKKPQSGIVRVLLTKLNLTDRAEISLDGSYSLNGVVFQRGCDIIVSCSTGDIYVYYEGMAWCCGKEMMLQRHPVASGENGLRFSGSYPLYTGSLKMTVSGGCLRAVLYVPLEEYLLGVVPYEMSDSYPLEALKAQAIAARTYTVKKMAENKPEFDVYDNTNDQVYYGVKAENINAQKAVSATAGICGTYNGALADCWYSASNGGQTDIPVHVWGGNSASWPYLIITDDPYDLENPGSTVVSYALPAEIAGTAFPQALSALLLDGVTAQAEELGISGLPEDIRPDRVLSIEPAVSMYPEDNSRVYTVLRFTLSVSGRLLNAGDEEEDFALFSTPAPTETPAVSSTAGPLKPLPAPVTVDIPVFDWVEPRLNMDINTSYKNELYTVRKEGETFIIEARRYGHGVGMSQRGAQWMALTYHKDHKEILAFYYPGMELTSMTFDTYESEPVAAAFLITPGPAATPTPRPTLVPLSSTPKPGQYSVIVNGIAEDSSLNMRLSPSTGSPIIRVLYYGQRLMVLGTAADGWLHVSADGIEGYVMEKFTNRE